MIPLRSLIQTALAAIVLLASTSLATANPEGGQVTAGAASISGQGTGALTVYQATPRVVIDWQSFSIGSGESATFIQPDASSIALNRVTGTDPSQIFGSLTSNGTVILVNRNGILFGESARVDVGGLVATTHDIGNDAFMAGGLLRFDRAGDPQASVVNQGTISIRNAGLAAFVAPHVVNDGIITANYGRVSLGAGTAFTLDLYGDELISFAIGDEIAQTITNADGTNAKALVENAGRISATEGRIQLTAAAARAVVNQSVNVSGIVEANSLSTTGGRIVLKGSGTVMTERSAQITADGHTGGEIRVEGNAIHLDGRVSVDGSTEAPRSAPQPNIALSEARRTQTLDHPHEDRGATPEPTPAGQGGTLTIKGGTFTSLDGMLSANAWSGGSILATANRNFALNGLVSATGTGGEGGRVSISATGETWEGSGSGIDVSGASGGSITSISGGKFVTSTNYLATGTVGTGGRIDVTGGDMFLLSSTYDASGLIGGGSVRLGGEYQGGKNLTADELPNARRLAANDGVKIDVSAKGNHGDAGTAVIWSDEKTTFLGSVYATGGLLSGVGGLVEASSADMLIWRGTVETAINGERGGTLLLDPKNITIADAGFSQLQLILRAFSGGPSGELRLQSNDAFGSSVSLDGTRLAVGAYGDDGATNACSDCGAVYLFTFTDSAFSGGTLAGRIGDGYTGAKDVNLAGTLENFDEFGSSVSLDGARLAVGASGDDGATDSCNTCGAVYLFTFTDTAFAGGTLAGRIGDGYTGSKDVNLAGTLVRPRERFGQAISLNGTGLAVGYFNSFALSGAVYLFTFTDDAFSGGMLAADIGESGSSGAGSFSLFGMSVSLDGTRLAVGVPGDDGYGSCSFGCGAVYLYTFNDLSFSGGTLAARIGSGYTGGNNVNLAGTLGSSDWFGSAVSLDGTRLAVGALYDDGATNACTDCGAVYLFTFTDTAFSSGTLAARIGDGYTGGNNVNLAGTLGSGDLFGSAVSLDGTRLAVGAYQDDGATSSCQNCGAVYFFTFTDSAFSGGVLAPRIGDGYLGSKDINLPGTKGEFSSFGSSVSLDGTRLAIGATGDDGATNPGSGSGAVYLFTFADSAFSGGTLAGRIGSGYTGGNNVNLAGTLENFDEFGSAVSLDGARLAVGAWRDDGATNACSDCGAVYLFTFTSLEFAGGALAAQIGNGHTGGKNINLILPSPVGGTLFGIDSLRAVSLDGARLAVGASGDDGATNSCIQCGAVYLFTFTDLSFTGGSLAARIGSGYMGSNNVDLAGTLEGAFSPRPNGDRGYRGDEFGAAVSLDGTRLAVGANFDDGATNGCPACGAVYLFTFTDLAFSGGTLAGRIGDGYTGGDNVNLAETLGSFDLFGRSVSLDGTRLAVGAFGDDGAMNSSSDSGAVYLFTFTDTAFSSGTLAGRIGDGYTGGNNVNLAGTLGSGDLFGSAVSLDGTRLAVGAQLDDGVANGCNGCGAVYLFAPGDTATLTGNAAYADNASASVTISPSQLTALLNAGTAVVLQASNDISVNNAITAANPGGDGGALTLQAGRSIFINANIFTDNGDLTLLANDLLANGVVDAYRDPGAAVITMATGTSINAGTGTVLFDLRSGAGKTNSMGGAITLTSVTASSITAQNAAAPNGNIVLAPGGVLNATGTGNAVVLAASDQFLNNAGAGAITTPSGRFVIYSQNWNNDTRGGLTGSNLYNRTYGANLPASLTQEGNLFVYAAQPILTVTANAASRTYGATNPTFSASITGLVNGDSAAYAYAGAAGFSTTTTASSHIGTYVGDILPNIGTLMSLVGYGFEFVGGDLSIDPASLIITASNASKTYGQTASLTNFTTSGLLFSDSVTGLSLSSLGAVNTANVGSYAINASGATGAGLSNYAISYASGSLLVNPAPLTITANDASKRFGQTLLFAGTEFTTTGLLFADTVSSVSLSSLGAQRLSAAGTYAITPSAAVGLGLGNYTIAYIDGTLTVTGGPRPWVPQPVGGDMVWPFDDADSLFCSADGFGALIEGGLLLVAANDDAGPMVACAQ
jgi:filamentous hemagglutinin family protein